MIISVLDFETTGLPPDGLICEWAFVDVNVGNDRKCTRSDVVSSLVNPGVSMPPEASAIHHLTDSDLIGAPLWHAERERIAKHSPDVWAAHQAPFERSFFDPPESKWIDTYKIAVTLWPDCPRHTVQCLRYWLGLKLDPGLAMPPHRAGPDAYVTAAILARAFRDFIITPEDMIAISAGPVILPKFHFGQHAGARLADKDAKGNWLVPTSYLDWIVKNITDNADVQHTAKCHLHDRREAERNRSPVQATPPEERSA